MLSLEVFALRLSVLKMMTVAVTILYSCVGFSLPGSGAQTFVNPIIAHGADPSVLFHAGMYYSVQSGCAHQGTTPVICIRAAATLPALGAATPVVVWTAPATGPNVTNVWAPEIEFLGGHWYIYFSAVSSTDATGTAHRLFALAPSSPGEPLGTWVEAPTGNPAGQLVTNWVSTWAIDPNVFQASDGNLYLVNACRQDNSGSPSGKAQSLCLSAMSDPLHLTGQTVALSKPVDAWETRGFPTEEGPFGFTHDGVDYILYSASFSGNPDQYATGVLINDHPPQPKGAGSSLTNPASWIKQGPIFDGHHASYGTASVVTAPSPDGTEIWNVYHGTDCLLNCNRVAGKTWVDRSVRTQRAGFGFDGSLVLGYPVDIADTDGGGEAVPLSLPSTGGAGSMTQPAWGAAFGDAAENDATSGQAVGSWEWSPHDPHAIRNTSLDPGQYDRQFFGANPNWQNYVIRTKVRMVRTGTGDAHPKYGVYGAYVDRNDYYVAMIDVTSCAAPGCVATDAVVNGADQGWENCPLPAGFDAAAPNTLVVESVNGMFHLSLNDEALAGACQGRAFSLKNGQNAANGSNGQAGVVVENTEAEYREFEISPGVPLDSQSSGQTYAFRNAASRLNLDNGCDGGCGSGTAEGTAGGTPVVQLPAAAAYPLTTSPTQLWTLAAQAGGAFKMVSSLTGLCVADSARAGGASHGLSQGEGGSGQVVQQPCTEAANQLWQLVPSGEPSSFVIENEASGLALDGRGKAEGRRVGLSRRGEGDRSHQWLLIVQ